jgi:hypothetical protein
VTTLTGIEPRRALATTYAAVTPTSIFLAVVVTNAVNILRVDFIGTNPNRPQSNAIFIALVMGPMLGVLVIPLFGMLSVAVAALSSTIVKRLTGRVPLWTLPIISLLCTGAFLAQAFWMARHVFPPDGDDTFPAAPRPGPDPIIWAGIYDAYLTALAVAWWLTRPRLTTNEDEAASTVAST